MDQQPKQPDILSEETGGSTASFRTALLLSLPLCVLAVAGLLVTFLSKSITASLIEWVFPLFDGLVSADSAPRIFRLDILAGVMLSAILICAACGFARKPWGLKTVRKSYILLYTLVLIWSWLVFLITNVEAGVEGGPSHEELFFWRMKFIVPALSLAMLTSVLHIVSWRRGTINYYTFEINTKPGPGDETFENIRTHGRDPEFRKSMLGSSFIHILVILIIPWLLRMHGCVEPYRIPLGSGNPAVAMVKMVQVKKKKRKQYIFAEGAAIIYERPDIDESDLLKEVKEDTELRYQATVQAAQGAIGTGGGNTPGWADGFADGEIRFIRIEYNGQNWDDGMGRTKADVNFLSEFRKLGGGKLKVRDRGESHPISYLNKYPKGQAPPFIYMTGSGHISVSGRDLETLRKYVQDGGMIFADCGSSRFDSSFRGFIRRVFPGNPLRPIADDDPIFQFPYTFPNGPPPLWHHGEKKTMGVKIRNRWGVFYFPGDLNDAWKDLRYSGLEPNLQKAAYYLGVNVVYHAFTHYLQETRKYRK